MTGAPIPLDPKSCWDSQLKFSQILPDFQTSLDRMARDSAAFAEGRALERIETGANPRQWAEWTQGTGTDPLLPVIIHGGYWRALKAEDHRFLMPALLPFGPAVASVEYRLKPMHAMAECVDDARAGLKALAAQFADARLILIGHSAGAHLALSAAQDAAIKPRIAGIISLSGVYDLAPVAASSLQEEIQFTPEEISRFSLAPSADRPPVLYVNGAHETHELLRASCLMAAQGRAQTVLLPDANHMTLTFAAAAEMPTLIARLQAL